MILHANRLQLPAIALALVLVGLLAIAVVAGCSGGDDPDGGGESTVVQVVTTTSFIADWAQNVGGDRVEVFSLVPTGADPHGFQPGARDVAKIAEADIVFSVGLSLEGSWLKELLENAARDPSTIIELSDAIEPIEFAESHKEDVELLEHIGEAVHEVEEGELTPEAAIEEIRVLLASTGEEEGGEDHAEEEEAVAMVQAIIDQVDNGSMDPADGIEEIEHLISEGEAEHEGHGHGLEDPHFWFDPLRVKLVVSEIVARLSVLDPDGADGYVSNASEYNAQLDELDEWTQDQVASIPDSQRFLVTSHDSFGYFADRYGFEVVGVILSTTTEAEPSAEHLTELVEVVEKYNVPAVFGEATVSERLATSIAEEAGAELIRLYSGSLGIGGSGAETYMHMVRTNVERIVKALK